MTTSNIIDKILDEKNNDILVINYGDGNIVKFEQVALIPLEEELFTILHPIEDDVEDDEVMIFRIDNTKEEMELVLEEDESIANEVFNKYYKLLSMKK